ncbi:hypothetical protein D5S18_18615 [Nocardia panacis]|uniref:Uncharacterized protein n=1 Tax=Nocardia panacis TaxID=2340916 RepID=A0A3A4K2M6_9NOCA|nr:hypothetical protein [Nocardia panacis]RJO74167.1 hypothetical protein D5S18_18615 [Nocardia panacis]
MRRLGGQHAVHLHHEGELHSFLPGDTVPEWAAERITNPHAWEPPTGAPAVSVTAEEDEDADSDQGDLDGIPAQAGPGASRARWASYAVANGVAVEEAWKRDDIIAACEAAGVRVA